MTPRRVGARPSVAALAIAGFLLAGASSAATGASSESPRAASQAAASPASRAKRPQGTRPSPRSSKATTERKKSPSATGTPAVREDGAPDAVVYGRREDVVAFAAQVAAERGLDREWVEAQLAKARFQPRVTRLVMPPAAGVPKNWAAYRARFIEPKRIQAGVAWMDAHDAELRQAEARYGVPPEIVAGIVGVETFYGRLMGHYRVLDALATLAFDFPSGRSDRSAFYRDELGAYLAWCAREHRDAETTPGSYAGAIGWPQFMPIIIFKYAIDFDGDGRIDLDQGGADVIGSVANYLAAFGWKRGQPTHYPVTPPAAAASRAVLLAPDIVPTFTPARMVAEGASLAEPALSHDGLLALVQLQNGASAPTFVAGTGNFYVVTRYNWSSYYAMAVIDLAESVRRERRFGPAARATPP